jgi:putative acyl-CoA dehydrogenase
VRTHEVLNQPEPLVDYDVFGCDTALVNAVLSYGAAASMPRLHVLGQLAGSAEASRWAEQANTFPPRLRTHDRYGNRIDEVEFHPPGRHFSTSPSATASMLPPGHRPSRPRT